MRRRQRNVPDTQGALQTSPADQEGIGSSSDGDSHHRGDKLSSSPQEDNCHPAFTKKGSKHVPTVQEGEKTPISAKREPIALVPILWGFIPPPVPKGSATSFPVSQGNYTRTICHPDDVIPALSCPGRDPSLQYEFGYPLCDPSVLGGHKYRHIVQSNLKRIPLQRGSCSSFLPAKGGIRCSQSDQCGLRLSSSHERDIGYDPHPISGSLRMFQAERDSFSNATSEKLGLRDTFYDKREFRNVSTNQKSVRPSSSALGRFQLTPSAQGGTRVSQPTKWNL